MLEKRLFYFKLNHCICTSHAYKYLCTYKRVRVYICKPFSMLHQRNMNRTEKKILQTVLTNVWIHKKKVSVHVDACIYVYWINAERQAMAFTNKIMIIDSKWEYGKLYSPCWIGLCHSEMAWGLNLINPLFVLQKGFANASTMQRCKSTSARLQWNDLLDKQISNMLTN